MSPQLPNPTLISEKIKEHKVTQAVLQLIDSVPPHYLGEEEVAAWNLWANGEGAGEGNGAVVRRFLNNEMESLSPQKGQDELRRVLAVLDCLVDDPKKGPLPPPYPQLHAVLVKPEGMMASAKDTVIATSEAVGVVVNEVTETVTSILGPLYSKWVGDAADATEVPPAEITEEVVDESFQPVTQKELTEWFANLSEMVSTYLDSQHLKKIRVQAPVAYQIKPQPKGEEPKQSKYAIELKEKIVAANELLADQAELTTLDASRLEALLQPLKVFLNNQRPNYFQRYLTDLDGLGSFFQQIEERKNEIEARLVELEQAEQQRQELAERAKQQRLTAVNSKSADIRAVLGRTPATLKEQQEDIAKLTSLVAEACVLLSKVESKNDSVLEKIISEAEKRIEEEKEKVKGTVFVAERDGRGFIGLLTCLDQAYHGDQLCSVFFDKKFQEIFKDAESHISKAKKQEADFQDKNDPYQAGVVEDKLHDICYQIREQYLAQLKEIVAQFGELKRQADEGIQYYKDASKIDTRAQQQLKDISKFCCYSIEQLEPVRTEYSKSNIKFSGLKQLDINLSEVNHNILSQFYKIADKEPLHIPNNRGHFFLLRWLVNAGKRMVRAIRKTENHRPQEEVAADLLTQCNPVTLFSRARMADQSCDQLSPAGASPLRTW